MWIKSYKSRQTISPTLSENSGFWKYAYVICSVTGPLHSVRWYAFGIIHFFLPAPFVHWRWKLILIAAANVQRLFTTPLIYEALKSIPFGIRPGPFSFSESKSLIPKQWVWNQTTMSDYFEWYRIEWQCEPKRVYCRIHYGAHTQVVGTDMHIFDNRWQSKLWFYNELWT